MVFEVTYTEPRVGFSTNFGTSIAAGETMVITLDSVSAYDNYVEISFGSKSSQGYIYSGDTQQSYSIPLSWLTEIPNASQGVGEISVYSIYDQSIVTSSSQSFTLTCPAYVVPNPGTQSLTYSNTKWDLLLQNYSSAVASLTGSYGRYGASIVSTTWTCSGSASGSASSAEYSTGVFTSSGNVSITATVIDSRGRRTSISTSVYVTPYRSPEITSMYAERCTGDNVGSSTGTGGHILVGCSYTVVGENAISTTVEYKERGASVWSGAIYITPSETEYSLFAEEGTFEDASSYDIRVTVTDSQGSIAQNVQTLGTAYAFMRWEPQMDAIGFGCYPQGAKRIELDESWDLYVKGQKIGGGSGVPDDAGYNTYLVTNGNGEMEWREILAGPYVARNTVLQQTSYVESDYVEDLGWPISNSFIIYTASTERYVVTYNGVPYTCKAQVITGDNTFICLGNATKFGGTSNGEPFQIVQSGNVGESHYGILVPLDGSTTATMELVNEWDSTRTISPSYLPSGTPYIRSIYNLTGKTFCVWDASSYSWKMLTPSEVIEAVFDIDTSSCNQYDLYTMSYQNGTWFLDGGVG